MTGREILSRGGSVAVGSGSVFLVGSGRWSGSTGRGVVRLFGWLERRGLVALGLGVFG